LVLADLKQNIRTFEDLKVWRQSRDLRKEISILVKSFPKTETYKLVDQLLRASRSVTANIAEGYGRFHYQENIQFCRQARGSLYEVIDHLICAYDEGYLEGQNLKKIREQTYRCIQLTNGYINYLRKAKNQPKVKDPKIHYSPNND
jgi:four helix bundle protein